MRFYYGLALALLAGAAQSQSPGSGPMSHRATGTFEVKVVPLGPANKDDDSIARFSIDKQYHGALEGAGKGEMLSTGNPASDAGAVAMETVTGRLDGRSGTFVLQHHGLMVGGKPQYWTITVVPGSGTGDLKGLNGTLQIIIENGRHSYVFDYTVPEKS